ncbi:MAG: polyphosphate polymerase domain-containing protein [Chlorobi bacterium]|nr:polyphosphate polymerase domain-containing protein [Chlorobiota bacterium]
MVEGYTELTTYRYERKFVTCRLFRAQVELIIRQNSAFFIPVFHPRRVNNIYFDTPGLDCYFDNLFGVSERWKARIRWYNSSFGRIANPILEFKIKKGFVGTKKSYPFPSFEIQRSFDANLFNQLISESDFPAEVKKKISGLQPVLLNTYTRNYFSSINGKFRITIDDQMEYYNLRPNRNYLEYAYKETGKTVVELKYGQEYDPEANIITNQFPFRLDKNSKFVSGMNHFRTAIAT